LLNDYAITKHIYWLNHKQRLMGLLAFMRLSRMDDFRKRTALEGCIRLQNNNNMTIIFDYLYSDQNTANLKPIDKITLTIFNITL
jgi:hypothetical protein